MKKVFSLLPLCALPVAVMAAQTDAKPNVVVILTDDLGIGDVGCYGQKTLQTPNIDTLAARGVKFTQHYSGAPVSAPSRASLLTGKHTGNSAIRGNFVGKRVAGVTYDFPLPAQESTAAKIFQNVGYVTACIGKWGLGSIADEGSPFKHGFDYFYGYETQIDAHRAYPQHLWEDSTKIFLDGKVYADEIIVSKALDFIDGNAEKPFFLYLATTLPHADILAPPEEVAKFDDGRFNETPYSGGYATQPKPRATFAAMVSRIDRTVARVVEQLKKERVYENTIIIFTSDNGTHKEGGHDPAYFNSNGGFRGAKRDLYQGGIIAPMIVSWPAKMEAGGRVSDHVSAFWDFLPTVCDLLDVQEPLDTDGISYLPTITGKERQRKHDYLYWEFHEEGGKQAILRDGWKLVRLEIKSGEPRYELYNLAEDTTEKKNLINEQPKLATQLRKIMDKARTPNKTWHFQQ